MGESENYLFFGTYCNLRSQSCLKHSAKWVNEVEWVSKIKVILWPWSKVTQISKLNVWLLACILRWAIQGLMALLLYVLVCNFLHSWYKKKYVRGYMVLSFIHSFISPFNHSIICLFIHLFLIHSFIHSLSVYLLSIQLFLQCCVEVLCLINAWLLVYKVLHWSRVCLIHYALFSLVPHFYEYPLFHHNIFMNT